MVKLAVMRSFSPEKNSQHAFERGASISVINVDNYVEKLMWNQVKCF